MTDTAALREHDRSCLGCAVCANLIQMHGDDFRTMIAELYAYRKRCAELEKLGDDLSALLDDCQRTVIAYSDVRDIRKYWPNNSVNALMAAWKSARSVLSPKREGEK